MHVKSVRTKTIAVIKPMKTMRCVPYYLESHNNPRIMNVQMMYTKIVHIVMRQQSH